MYFVYILYCSFTRLHVSPFPHACIPHQHQRRIIRHRPSTLQRQSAARIGANYDSIKRSKMDDLVSRIINVSMDLYFYYIPITLDNGRAFNKFRVYATRPLVRSSDAQVQPRVHTTGRKGMSLILSSNSLFVSLNVPSSIVSSGNSNKFEP